LFVVLLPTLVNKDVYITHLLQISRTKPRSSLKVVDTNFSL